MVESLWSYTLSHDSSTGLVYAHFNPVKSQSIGGGIWIVCRELGVEIENKYCISCVFLFISISEFVTEEEEEEGNG